MSQKFKIGDFVKANPNNELNQECGHENFAGKVVNYDGFLGTYDVALDAQSLAALPDDYIYESLILFYHFQEQDFEEDQLLPAQRRDTDEAYAKATARIDNLQKELEELGLINTSDDGEGLGDMFDPERTRKIILWELDRSDKLKAFSAEDRSGIVSDAGLMLEVATNYYSLEHPEEWTPDFVEDYALSHLPRKFLGSPDDFEQMGKNLIVFVEWLYEEDISDCGRLLMKAMRKVAPKMAEAAKDDSKFGLSKGIFSQALGEGVDLTDPKQIDQFVDRFNSQSFEDREAQTSRPRPQAKVIGLDPFRHFGRNDRITVRDTTTGEVQEKVKFKVVEARLRDGGLELVE